MRYLPTYLLFSRIIQPFCQRTQTKKPSKQHFFGRYLPTYLDAHWNFELKTYFSIISCRPGRYSFFKRKSQLWFFQVFEHFALPKMRFLMHFLGTYLLITLFISKASPWFNHFSISMSVQILAPRSGLFFSRFCRIPETCPVVGIHRIITFFNYYQ